MYQISDKTKRAVDSITSAEYINMIKGYLSPLDPSMILIMPGASAIRELGLNSRTRPSNNGVMVPDSIFGSKD